MTLANYDINKQLTHLFQEHLTNNHLSFKELKALLISKAPVPAIHDQISKALSQLRTSEKDQSKSTLEDQAYERQISEDREEDRSDKLSSLTDSHYEQEWRSKLANAHALQSQYEQEIARIQATLHPQIPANSTHQHPSKQPGSQNVHTHADGANLHQHPAPSVNPTVHTHEDGLRKRLKELQNEIDRTQIGQSLYAAKLLELRGRAGERQNRQQNREQRRLARLEASAKTLGVAHTLSSENRARLIADIDKESRLIDEQFSRLMSQSTQLNYPLFLQELDKFLKSGSRMTIQENEALSNILKLMKQHLAHQKDAETTQAQLQNILEAIDSSKRDVERLKAKLVTLNQANPHLAKVNRDLEELNATLSLERDNNNKSRDKLTNTSIILFGLSVLSSIPLTLLLTGVMHVMIEPLLLLTLASMPPAMLLIATLGVGISAIVHALNASSNKSEIERNSQCIEANKKQMTDNSQEYTAIDNQQIPALQVTIAKNEETKERLTESLKRDQSLAEQCLQRANDIERSTYNPSRLFVVSMDDAPPAYTTGSAPSAPPIDHSDEQPGATTTLASSAPPQEDSDEEVEGAPGIAAGR